MLHLRNTRSRRLPVASLAASLAAIVAIAGSLAGCSSTPGGTPTPAPALRAVSGSRYFGTAVDEPQLDLDATYSAILGSQFSSVTAENSMKWTSTEPTKGTFDWSMADKFVAFAQAHGQKIHGHNLVWHNQLPSWLDAGSFSKTELSDLLQGHITAEVGRYAGKIAAWDVVNEPLNEDGTMRDSIWLENLGQGYIADALKWAHAADPAAKLYINDYNLESVGPKSDAMYDLAKSLKAAGAPLDGIGFQGHLDTTYPFPSDWAKNMQRFADLGLEVAITELDVRVNVPADAAALASQAGYYKDAVSACVAVSRCVGVTVWEFTDKYSWVPTAFPGEGAACLYDSDMAPKPAFAAVEQAFLGK